MCDLKYSNGVACQHHAGASEHVEETEMHTDDQMITMKNEYPRVSMAEGFNADQHPDIVPGLQLTLAPLHLIVVCIETKCSQS